MAWFGVCSGNWCVGGKKAGEEGGNCGLEKVYVCVSVMTSLSMHASIFCCADFTAASHYGYDFFSSGLNLREGNEA